LQTISNVGCLGPSEDLLTILLENAWQFDSSFDFRTSFLEELLESGGLVLSRFGSLLSCNPVTRGASAPKKDLRGQVVILVVIAAVESISA